MEILQIILTSLYVSMSATLLASLFAIPFGLYLGTKTHKWARRIRPVLSTFASLPPVIAGVTIFLLLSNAGPLGDLRLLYTTTAIIIAQFILVLPLVTVTIIPSVITIRDAFLEVCDGLHIQGLKRSIMLIKEIKTTILIAILLGFGRAISEVGAVMMVGGNIRFKTRVMTTAIVLETRQGNYETGLLLGLALLVISLAIQGSAHYFLRGNQDD